MANHFGLSFQVALHNGPSSECCLQPPTVDVEERTERFRSALPAALAFEKMGRSDESPGDTNSDGLNGHGFPRKHTDKYDEIWWFCMLQRHVSSNEFLGVN